MTGIYKIDSIVKPNKCYIGSSINLSSRTGKHLNSLKLNKHFNSKLQNHYNKYGIEDLVFSILVANCDKNDLILLEQCFINSYDPWFNICKIAGSGLGRKYKNRKRGPMSDETKQKIRETKLGDKNPMFGKSPSIETRQKMREASIRNGNKPPTPIKGIPMSEETKNKLRKPNKYPMSEQGRKNISNSHKGLIPWNKGKKMPPHTEDFKNKQSEGLKKWWKLRKLKDKLL